MQRNLFALHQRIADQPVPVKVFPVHIDGSDLVVAVGRVVVNALVSVAAACVERDLVLAAVQLTAAALLLDSVQDVEELPDALGLAAAGFRVHPHKGRTHKAGLAGQIARQAQCAEAAAVDGQVKAVRKRNRRRARRECAVVVQCEKLLRERRIVRQYTDGVIVDVQAVGGGLHHDTPRFVGNEPVQLREGQLLTERDIDDVGFCKQRAHLGQRRTATQQPGDQFKLSDVVFSLRRRVVDVYKRQVTAFSIITDYQKGIKYPIADFEITPDVAIVDPELAHTMPKKLVAHTGMDAMTHAIEAYVSTANCDFTDPLALHAIEMIQADLVGSYNGDMDKRDAMHNAQCLAGMAFSNALLGIVHSMAHKTGAAFADYGAHIIHGAANAMYLPKVIAYNAKDPTAKARYGVIADKMHLGGENDDEKVALLIQYLRGMNDDLNIPHCIGHYGPDSYPAEQGFVPENVFLERLPEIAKNAIADACTGSNPRQPTQEEMEKLLKCCYYDTEVDF